MIENYRFGEITINGKKYRRDLIILPDKIIDNWWRKEGHNLCIDDLREVLEEDIDILIIGTGYYGFMKVPEKVVNKLKENGIDVIVKSTREACKVFNEMSSSKDKKIAAAFHLTC